MSENTNTNTNDAPTNDAKVKNTRKRTPRESFTVQEIANAVAKRKGTDPFRAAKDVRGKLRANWSTVVKLDPSILKVKDAPNDGTRWPKVNAKVRAFILDGKRK